MAYQGQVHYDIQTFAVSSGGSVSSFVKLAHTYNTLMLEVPTFAVGGGQCGITVLGALSITSNTPRNLQVFNPASGATLAASGANFGLASGPGSFFLDITPARGLLNVGLLLSTNTTAAMTFTLHGTYFIGGS